LWTRLSRLRRQRRLQTAMTLGLVFLGPVLVVATFLALGPLDQGAGFSRRLRLILLADLVYVLVIAALVLARVARMIADRRSHARPDRGCTCGCPASLPAWRWCRPCWSPSLPCCR
jgi:two-component system nitrogen regulation sensor histidine kinase NtrY